MRDPETNPTDTQHRYPVRTTLILAVVFAVTWLLWSGLFKPLLIGLGALSCLLTLWVVQRMKLFTNDSFSFRFGLRIIPFWAWLAKEIVVSSIRVSRVVLAPKIEVSPGVVVLDVAHLRPGDQAVLGNSITLTPGTLTLDVHDDQIVAHALTRDGIADLKGGEMKRRVTALRAD